MSSSLKEAVSILLSHAVPFPVRDLPKSMSDPLWPDICSTYKLSLPQLSALKNEYCIDNQSLLLEIRETISIVDKKLSSVDRKVDKVEEKVVSIDGRTKAIEFEANYVKYNPWLDTSSRDSRVKQLRGKVLKVVGSELCWLTGLEKTKIAHILPDSTKRCVLKKLRLPDNFKNNHDAKPWNFLVLDEVLEEAFDRMRISFVPKGVIHTSTFYLTINDQSCLKEKLTDGKSCIGDYVGKVLQVPESIEVSRRALSYQALMSYIHWTKYIDEKSSTNDMAEPFLQSTKVKMKLERN
jgi:hypothetical protein